MRLTATMVITAMALLVLMSSKGLATKAVQSGASAVQPTPESSTAQAAATTLTGEQIDRQVISSGGGPGTSPNFALNGTAGQAAAGAGASTQFGLSHGFWVTTSSGCCIIRADIDHSGAGPDIADLVYLVNYMFNGGAEPPCMEEADVDGSGSGPDIADLVYLVNYMFNGGPPPAPC
ncbi:MAG: hypothetical protein ABIE70_04895 [bacterium]